MPLNSQSNNQFGVLLLAAGASSRMGQSKQLLPIDKVPLLRSMTLVAVSSRAGNVFVVLGSRSAEHAALISDLPVEVISNPSWEKGMGNSLKAGLEHFLDTMPGLQGVIVMLCDQPLVRQTHLDTLVEKHLQTAKPIVASGYAEGAGVPAFFEKKYFGSLLRLDDRSGAKQIIADHREEVFVVDFPQGATDLDTLDDYHNFIKH